MSFGGQGFGQSNAEQEMMQAISMKVMLKTSTSCFSECVTKFSAERLDNGEISCLKNCAKRTMEGFASMNEVQGKMMQGGGGGF